MQNSPELKNLAAALARFQASVPKIKKDSVNPFFKNKYADLATIIETVRPELAKQGLSISQFPTNENRLTTILMHESGEWLAGEYLMRPTKQDPQGTGSAITYARRYALAAVLGIAADDDDDGNAASAAEPQKKVVATKPPYLVRLGQVKTPEELDAVVAEIAADKTISDTMKKSLREVYAQRKETIALNILTK